MRTRPQSTKILQKNVKIMFVLDQLYDENCYI